MPPASAAEVARSLLLVEHRPSRVLPTSGRWLCRSPEVQVNCNVGGSAQSGVQLFHLSSVNSCSCFALDCCLRCSLGSGSGAQEEEGENVSIRIECVQCIGRRATTSCFSISAREARAHTHNMHANGRIMSPFAPWRLSRMFCLCAGAINEVRH